MLAVADKKYTLRIPEDLHAQIETAAKKERRSLHAQMLVMIQEALDRRQQQQKPDREPKQ